MNNQPESIVDSIVNSIAGIDENKQNTEKNKSNGEDINNIKQENEISIYPNPTRNNVTLTVNNTLSEKINSIKVVTLHGEIIKNVDFQKNFRQVNINFSNLSSGLYMIYIQLKGGSTIAKRIIKQ